MLKNLLNKKCPDDETIACYIDGLLSSKEKALFENHLRSCVECCQMIEIQKKVALLQNKEEFMEVPSYLVVSAKSLFEQKQKIEFLEIVATVVDDFLKGIRTTGEIISGLTAESQGVFSSVIMRSGSSQKPTSFTVKRIFKDVRVEVLVSRANGDMSNIVLKFRDDRTDAMRTDLRATLILDNIELESYVTRNGKVAFENVRPGSYSILVSNLKVNVGVITMELIKG